MSVPDRIDRYLIERELGRGSFGAVYKARHTVIGREVALKVLHPERATTPSVLERFLGEARAVAAIGSPHIVQVYDAGLTPDGKAFLAMELLDGEDLGQHLTRHGRLAPDRVMELGRQVCLGLAAAHRAGVIHRDLKPANIFLAKGPDGRAQAKVLDFGISKIARPEGEELTMTGTMLGTPHYMAPEQLQSSRDVDARADLYALGTVLFEMLSLELPYSADTLAGLIASKMSDAPRSLPELAPDVPGPLAEVILRSLSWEPNARFATADQMEQALAAAMSRGSSPHRNSAPRAFVEAPTQVAGSGTGLAGPPSYRPTPSTPMVGAQSSIVSLPGIVNATDPSMRAPGTTEAPFRKWLTILGVGIMLLGAVAAIGFTVLAIGLALLERNLLHADPPPAPPTTVTSPVTPMPPNPAATGNLPVPPPLSPSAAGPPSMVAGAEAPTAVPSESEAVAGHPRIRLTPMNLNMDVAAMNEVARTARPHIEACTVPAGYDARFIVTRLEVGGAFVAWNPASAPMAVDPHPATTSCILDAFQWGTSTLAPGGTGIANYHVVSE